jgi:putative Flp pilus-assembly TadE/G-like protein
MTDREEGVPMAIPSDRASNVAAPSRLSAVIASLSGLVHDRSGATAMIVGLGATMLVGFAGLGTEMGLWYFTHRSLQNAADSAAMSAEAALFYADGDYIKEAKASAARYGFADGTNGVSVTVNKPPASGAYAGIGDAVEVIISEPQVRLFTAIFSNSALTQTARAVAQVGSNGNGCVVTLDKNAVVDLFGNGNTSLNLTACDLYVNASACDAIDQSGNHTAITAENIYVVASPGCNGVNGNGDITGNLIPHVAPINDPYANVPQPGSHDPSCTNTSPTADHTYTGGTVTLSPGNYCGGISVTGGASVHLNPGVYVIDGGSFSAGGNGGNSSGTITGDGVTIFLTGSGSNYATVQIAGNGAVTITPPTSGDTAGISLFQDRSAPGPSCDVSTTNCTPQNKIQGNGDAITGVAYFPNQSVGWGGNGNTNSPACAQVVAFQLQTVGNAQFSNNCTGVAGVKNIGALAGRLVE